MIYIIALICLIGGFGFGIYLAARNHYYFFRRSSHKKISSIEDAVASGLLQKREHYEEKQKTELAEIEEKLQAEHSNKLSEIEHNYNCEKERLSEHFAAAQKEASDSYCRDIQQKEASYKDQLAALNDHFAADKEVLEENFQKFSDEINLKKATLTEEINAFEKKQAAIIEQFKKDEETRKQRDFYHVEISTAAKRDIEKLKEIAISFSRPEVLYKLIYEVYYKAALEELFKRVLKDNKDKGGIYKITNIKDERIYIGKSVKLLDRWRTHAKRGCNIERISGLLYEAMFKEGLENFTFEIVELCDKDAQSEKEKYWIEFYKSDKWGYNMRRG